MLTVQAVTSGGFEQPAHQVHCPPSSMLTEKTEKDAVSLNICSIRMNPSMSYMSATDILKQCVQLLPSQQISIMRILNA